MDYRLFKIEVTYPFICSEGHYDDYYHHDYVICDILKFKTLKPHNNIRTLFIASHTHLIINYEYLVKHYELKPLSNDSSIINALKVFHIYEFNGSTIENNLLDDILIELEKYYLN